MLWVDVWPTTTYQQPEAGWRLPCPAWWCLSRCMSAVQKGYVKTVWPRGVYSSVRLLSQLSPQTWSTWSIRKRKEVVLSRLNYGKVKHFNLVWIYFIVFRAVFSLTFLSCILLITPLPLPSESRERRNWTAPEHLCLYQGFMASLAAKTAAGGLPALPSTCEIFYAVWVPWVHLVRHWNGS